MGHLPFKDPICRQAGKAEWISKKKIPGQRTEETLAILFEPEISREEPKRRPK